MKKLLILILLGTTSLAGTSAFAVEADCMSAIDGINSDSGCTTYVFYNSKTRRFTYDCADGTYVLTYTNFGGSTGWQCNAGVY